jgi:predicted DNA-binding transcriptional regulator AlpA
MASTMVMVDSTELQDLIETAISTAFAQQKTKTNQDRTLTAKEVCEMLHISATTLWKYGNKPESKKKLFPLDRVTNGSRVYKLVDVERLLVKSK